jgi:hypothetical protein
MQFLKLNRGTLHNDKNKSKVISIGDHIYPLDKCQLDKGGCSNIYPLDKYVLSWTTFVQSTLLRIKFYPVDKYDRQLKLL